MGHQTRTASELGSYEKTVSLKFMVNSRGQPVRGLSLDLFWLPFFLLSRLSTDLVGCTPGRRLVGIRVVGDDYDVPASSDRLLRRYAVFGLPFLALWLTHLVAFSLDGILSFLDSPAFIPALIFELILYLIPTVLAFRAIRRGEDAFYDLVAGTSVVRFFLSRRDKNADP